MPTQQELYQLEIGASGVPSPCTLVQPSNARQVGAECGVAAFVPFCSGAVIYGCTNPLAENYNPAATADDGTCILPPSVIPGCTDPTALNYDPQATVNDGSCEYAPTDDFTLSIDPATQTVTEVTALLHAYINGNVPPPPPGFTCLWEQILGDPVDFIVDPVAQDTAVYASTSGVRTFRLTVSSGDVTKTANATVTWNLDAAFLRVWNMYDDYGGEVITVSGISGTSFPYIAQASEYLTGYQEVTPGSYNPQCIGDSFLQSLPITLESGKYYTLFMRRKYGGGQEVFLVDDNWNAGDSPRMRMYQLRRNFQGKGDYIAPSGPLISTDFLLDGQSVELTGIPAEDDISCEFLGQDIPNGTNRTWNTAINFSVNRLATTLMIDDLYGRWRPRVIYDGPTG